MSFTSLLIKKGDKYFLCAHDQDTGYHFFQILDNEKIVNEKGEVVEGRCILLCDACFALADESDDPTPYIARTSEWDDDVTAYFQKKEASVPSLRIEMIQKELAEWN